MSNNNDGFTKVVKRGAKNQTERRLQSGNNARQRQAEREANNRAYQIYNAEPNRHERNSWLHQDDFHGAGNNSVDYHNQENLARRHINEGRIDDAQNELGKSMAGRMADRGNTERKVDKGHKKYYNKLADRRNSMLRALNRPEVPKLK